MGIIFFEHGNHFTTLLLDPSFFDSGNYSIKNGWHFHDGLYKNGQIGEVDNGIDNFLVYNGK